MLFSFLWDLAVLGDKPGLVSAAGSGLVAAGVLFVALTPVHHHPLAPAAETGAEAGLGAGGQGHRHGQHRHGHGHVRGRLHGEADVEAEAAPLLGAGGTAAVLASRRGGGGGGGGGGGLGLIREDGGVVESGRGGGALVASSLVHLQVEDGGSRDGRSGSSSGSGESTPGLPGGGASRERGRGGSGVEDGGWQLQQPLLVRVVGRLSMDTAT